MEVFKAPITTKLDSGPMPRAGRATGTKLIGVSGRTPGLPSLVVSSSVAVLHSSGRVLDALLGIPSRLSGELRQPGLALEVHLHLTLEQIDVGVQQLVRRAHGHEPGQALRPGLAGVLSQLE